MKKVNLERYFKLFTNEEAEHFFDTSLKEQQIKFVKREIPDSKFSEYFFNEKDIILVEIINEKLKEKEFEETEKLTSKKHNRPYRIELILTLVLIALIIAFVVLV
ncbi:hypothetical protein IMCC3317_29070 [Kordia antarctica]|uniref:Uncharacterized protein n=1 Tax=Kordia antarctica TaxID=1218801 RepID=A0A7L4ZLE7_9FLAO|nr:heme biosynthesis HemY N-terminal domain-containing protein [Kordia antarctica]QHI37528.1 hypothetical protein IMCC3317_29070 [Kordia antarctica]